MDIENGIDELVKLQKQTLARLTAGPAELLDVEAVAALVGVSANTIWALNRSGDFPVPVDVGGLDVTRWRRTEILTWIARRKPRKKPKRATT